MNVERDVVTYLYTVWDDSSKKTKMAFVGESRQKIAQNTKPKSTQIDFGVSQVTLACQCARLFPHEHSFT